MSGIVNYGNNYRVSYNRGGVGSTSSVTSTGSSGSIISIGSAGSITSIVRASNVNQIFSETLLKIYKIPEDAIEKYFYVVSVSKTGYKKYTLKSGCGFKTLDELRNYLYQLYKNDLILDNFLENQNKKGNLGSQLTQTDSGESLTVANYNKYIEEIDLATEEESSEIRKKALDKFIIDFSSGNLTNSQASMILEAIGINNFKLSSKNNMYTYTFEYDNKKYTVSCSKEAAKRANDDIWVEVITQEMIDELNLDKDTAERFFIPVSTQDNETLLYKLANGYNSLEDVIREIEREKQDALEEIRNNSVIASFLAGTHKTEGEFTITDTINTYTQEEKAEVLQQMLVDFATGNLTIEQAQDLAIACGVEDLLLTNGSTQLRLPAEFNEPMVGNCQLSFSFGNIKYVTNCNLQASEKANDNICITLYSSEEVIEICGGRANYYFDVAASFDNKAIQYKLKSAFNSIEEVKADIERIEEEMKMEDEKREEEIRNNSYIASFLAGTHRYSGDFTITNTTESYTDKEKQEVLIEMLNDFIEGNLIPEQADLLAKACGAEFFEINAVEENFEITIIINGKKYTAICDRYASEDSGDDMQVEIYSPEEISSIKPKYIKDYFIVVLKEDNKPIKYILKEGFESIKDVQEDIARIEKEERLAEQKRQEEIKNNSYIASFLEGTHKASGDFTITNTANTYTNEERQAVLLQMLEDFAEGNLTPQQAKLLANACGANNFNINETNSVYELTIEIAGKKYSVTCEFEAANKSNDNIQFNTYTADEVGKLQLDDISKYFDEVLTEDNKVTLYKLKAGYNSLDEVKAVEALEKQQKTITLFNNTILKLAKGEFVNDTMTLGDILKNECGVTEVGKVSGAYKEVKTNVLENKIKVKFLEKDYVITYKWGVTESRRGATYPYKIATTVYSTTQLINAGVPQDDIGKYFEAVITENGVGTHFRVKSGWTYDQIIKEVTKQVVPYYDNNGNLVKEVLIMGKYTRTIYYTDSKMTKRVYEYNDGKVLTDYFENGVKTKSETKLANGYKETTLYYSDGVKKEHVINYANGNKETTSFGTNGVKIKTVINYANGDKETILFDKNGRKTKRYYYTAKTRACKTTSYDANGKELAPAKDGKLYGSIEYGMFTMSAKGIYNSITTEYDSGLVTGRSMVKTVAGQLSANLLGYAQPGYSGTPSGCNKKFSNYSQTNYSKTIANIISTELADFGYEPYQVRGYQFEQTSSLAKKMAVDTDLKKYIKDNIKDILNGNINEGPTFNENKDLANALHGTNLLDSKLNGTILTLTIFDLYDFDYKDGNSESDILNNVGAAAMEDGLLVPYFMIIDVAIDLNTIFSKQELKDLGIG